MTCPSSYLKRINAVPSKGSTPDDQQLSLPTKVIAILAKKPGAHNHLHKTSH